MHGLKWSIVIYRHLGWHRGFKTIRPYFHRDEWFFYLAVFVKFVAFKLQTKFNQLS
jgi:hypothetical protein